MDNKQLYKKASALYKKLDNDGVLLTCYPSAQNTTDYIDKLDNAIKWDVVYNLMNIPSNKQAIFKSNVLENASDYYNILCKMTSEQMDLLISQTLENQPNSHH